MKFMMKLRVYSFSEAMTHAITLHNHALTKHSRLPPGGTL